MAQRPRRDRGPVPFRSVFFVLFVFLVFFHSFLFFVYFVSSAFFVVVVVVTGSLVR